MKGWRFLSHSSKTLLEPMLEKRTASILSHLSSILHILKESKPHEKRKQHKRTETNSANDIRRDPRQRSIGAEKEVKA